MIPAWIVDGFLAVGMFLVVLSATAWWLGLGRTRSPEQWGRVVYERERRRLAYKAARDEALRRARADHRA